MTVIRIYLLSLGSNQWLKIKTQSHISKDMNQNLTSINVNRISYNKVTEQLELNNYL